MSLIPITVFGASLTSQEVLFVQNISSLAYEQGDILYYNGTDLTVLHHGTSGQFLKTFGNAANPDWATIPGGGDVLKVGTPVNNQVGVWTGDGTLEGDAALTFDTSTDTLTTGKLVVSGDSIYMSGNESSFQAPSNNDGDYMQFYARDSDTNSLAIVGGLFGAANPYFGLGGAGEFRFYNDGTSLVALDKKIQFGDAAVHIQSDDDGHLDLTADVAVDVNGTLNISTLTASEIVATDASKNLVSLAVATYPSLTELSYVKGVTSGIQSQLNAKGAGDFLKDGSVVMTGTFQTVTGTTTVSPIKMTAGTNLTTPVAGVIEFDGTNLFISI